MKSNKIVSLAMAGFLVVAPYLLGGCSRDKKSVPRNQPTSQGADKESYGTGTSQGKDENILITIARLEAAANKGLIERLRNVEVPYKIGGVGSGEQHDEYFPIIEALMADAGRHGELRDEDNSIDLRGATGRMDRDRNGILTGNEVADYLINTYPEFVGTRAD